MLALPNYLYRHTALTTTWSNGVSQLLRNNCISESTYFAKICFEDNFTSKVMPQ